MTANQANYRSATRPSMHERRRPGGTWDLVALARFLWPKELLEQLEAGQSVTLDGYEWRKAPVYERRMPDGHWTSTHLAQCTWPKDLLASLELGKTVFFEGYEWRKPAPDLVCA